MNKNKRVFRAQFAIGEVAVLCVNNLAYYHVKIVECKYHKEKWLYSVEITDAIKFVTLTVKNVPETQLQKIEASPTSQKLSGQKG